MEGMTALSSPAGVRSDGGQGSRGAATRWWTFTRFTAVLSASLVLATLGCYGLRDLQTGDAPGLGLSVTGTSGERLPAANDKDLISFHLRANDPAHLKITFDKGTGRRTTQAIVGAAFYEIRAIYTEAVVRSTANLADYHMGVKAQPNSLIGYSLNVPPSGNTLPPGTIGVGVLRYAVHPTLDDPIYPSLADKTKAINPVTGPGLYFLAQGILKTDHDGFPPPVRDVFGDTPSKVVASPTDVQSIKLGMASVEYLLNNLWAGGLTYTDASGSHTVASATQDRPLTDNTSITMTRYYKWRLPFSATTADLGSGLPIGRAVFDVRVVAANGDVITYGTEGAQLGSGDNILSVLVWDDGQKLATNIDVSLPPYVGPATSSTVTPEPFVFVPPPPTPRPGRRYSLVATIAGTGVEGLVNGPALLSRFRNPVAGTVGPDGSLYIADFDNNVIRKYTVNASGSALVSTVNAPIALSKPSGVAVDASGNVYIGDHENASIVKVTPAGVVQTLATGIGKPRGVAVTSDGTVYFASDTGHFIGQITPSGQVSSLAGSTAGYEDGSGSAAKFFNPYGISLDPGGSILVADFSNSRIRRVSPAGVVTTIAGTSAGDVTNPNRLDHPGGAVADQYGNVYIADTFRHRIRLLYPDTGEISDLAGTGVGGHADGDALGVAQFNLPYGITINASGDIYVMEVGSDYIRVIL